MSWNRSRCASVHMGLRVGEEDEMKPLGGSACKFQLLQPFDWRWHKLVGKTPHLGKQRNEEKVK